MTTKHTELYGTPPQNESDRLIRLSKTRIVKYEKRSANHLYDSSVYRSIVVADSLHRIAHRRVLYRKIPVILSVLHFRHSNVSKKGCIENFISTQPFFNQYLAGYRGIKTLRVLKRPIAAYSFFFKTDIPMSVISMTGL